ncbi:MAG: UDP-N-acetylmuramoyl-L-alanine--D-glutamate ligase [Kiritimatiellaeota bacterium]|nr:UDP-N-acetylmuramoyl-L-alanine--D-glutamate ligase [Kiritimatiellota bacterium]
MKAYRQALVCGLGSSGVAAARLLRAEGSAVTALDGDDTPELRARAAPLAAAGVRVLLGAQALPAGGADVAIVSPSLALSSPWLVELRRRGVPLLAELEFGWSRQRGRTIAVTGSNGKSTAVKWLAESLQQAGRRAAPAGNYGPPVSRVVAEQPDLDWLVLEVSTFQLETCRAFRPDIGLLLNIHPNHLDRHGDLAAYTALKARLFARATGDDLCLAPAALLDLVRALSGGRGQWRTFGLTDQADFRYRDGWIWRRGRPLADLRGTRFANEVLGVAGAAVVAALDGAGLPPECAVRAARQFVPLPHRLQTVAELRGVRYVNDSKATNLAALGAALSMTPGPVRLIAGGLVKEKDFGGVKEMLAEKAARVYLIGQAAEALAAAWADAVPCTACGTLAAAVRQAGADARAGETVLLAPACASFDQFKNFEERGDRFMELVAALGVEIERTTTGKQQEECENANDQGK